MGYDLTTVLAESIDGSFMKTVDFHKGHRFYSFDVIYIRYIFIGLEQILHGVARVELIK